MSIEAMQAAKDFIEDQMGDHPVASEILDDLNAAIKAAQPPELPGAADDEAARCGGDAVSGKPAQKRSQVLAIRAAKLAEQGWTHRNIAETLGIKPEQVSARVTLGERLIQLQKGERP